MSKLAEAYVEIRADQSGLAGDLAKAREKVGSETRRMAEQAAANASRMQAAFAAAFAVEGLSMFTSAVRSMFSNIVSAGSRFESIQLAFENLFGGAEAGAKMMADMKKFALATPFEMTGLADAAKRLNVAKFAAQDIIPVLHRVGDVIGGMGGDLGGNLDTVIDVISKMSLRGRVMAVDMNRLAAVGVPALDAMAKQMGVSTAEAMARMKRGAVDGAVGIRAVLAMADDPRFKDGRVKASKTFAGIMSNFTDLTTQTAADIGKPLFEGVKRMMNSIVNYLQGDESRAFRDAARGLFAGMASAIDALTPIILASLPAIIQWGGAFLAITVGLPALIGGLRLLSSVVMIVPNYIIGAISSVAGMVSSAVGAVVSAASGLLQTVGRVLSALYDVGASVASVFRAAGGVALGAAVSIFRFGYGLIETLTSAAGTVLRLTANIASKFASVATAALAGLINVAVGLLSVLSSIVAVGLALPLIFSAIAVAGAAAAAVVVTLGVGIAQLGAMLTVGVAGLWAGFKIAVAAVFAWVSDRVGDMHRGMVGMWAGFKDAAARAFVAVGDAMQKIAGFFWNFKDNIRVIGDWWSVNWRTALADIGRFAAMIIENVAFNFMQALSMMGGVAYAALAGVWKLAGSYFAVVMLWIRSEWSNLWSDAGTIFKTFLANLIANFKTLLPLIDAIAKHIGLSIRDATGLFAHGIGKQRQDQMTTGVIEFHTAMLLGDMAAALAAKAKVAEVSGSTARKLDTESAPTFKGPLEGLPDLKTGTGPLSFMGLLTEATLKNAEVAMPAMFKSISAALTEGLKGMSPLISADFKAASPWKSLLESFNLKLPEGAAKKVLNSLAGLKTPGMPDIPAGAAKATDQFVGFADMWKQVQKSAQGAKMEDFAKRTATATEETKKGVDRAAAAAARTADAVEKMRPGMA